jgi:hypothetical protein
VKYLPPGLPKERKEGIVQKNIKATQQELLSQGNDAAVDPNVVVKAAADARVSTGAKETISEAASQVTGVPKEHIKQEIKILKEQMKLLLHLLLNQNLKK